MSTTTWFTPKHAAAYCQVDVVTLRRAVQRGDLRAFKVNGGHRVRYRAADLDLAVGLPGENGGGMTRCIAFHQGTGERCARRVSIQRDLQHLKLCREHGRSILLTMFSDAMSRDERDALAEGTWTNVREVRRG